MGEITYQHEAYADGKWAELPLHLQMASIGSEVSRALRWKDKKPNRFESSLARALELFDLSIAAAQERREFGQLKELCRAREELCDYLVGENEYNTDPARLMRYYDQFALLKISLPSL